ncbi:hypothetical protein ACNJX9_08790 [Bradyrhizobium sp. DASA03076]|uniref:hypothetical protein n=1 Tax=Bradyrhizobium sp. BLXBL-03 TaxID=3395916 RepID=UPI003F6EAD44
MEQDGEIAEKSGWPALEIERVGAKKKLADIRRRSPAAVPPVPGKQQVGKAVIDKPRDRHRQRVA